MKMRCELIFLFCYAIFNIFMNINVGFKTLKIWRFVLKLTNINIIFK